MVFWKRINRNEIFGVEKVILDIVGIYPNGKFPSWKLWTTAVIMSSMLVFQVLILESPPFSQSLKFIHFQLNYLRLNIKNIIDVASSLPEVSGCIVAIIKLFFLIISAKRLKSLTSKLFSEWNKSW